MTMVTTLTLPYELRLPSLDAVKCWPRLFLTHKRVRTGGCGVIELYFEAATELHGVKLHHLLNSPDILALWKQGRTKLEEIRFGREATLAQSTVRTLASRSVIQARVSFTCKSLRERSRAIACIGSLIFSARQSQIRTSRGKTCLKTA